LKLADNAYEPRTSVGPSRSTAEPVTELRGPSVEGRRVLAHVMGRLPWRE
jgi:hypothetical protein